MKQIPLKWISLLLVLMVVSCKSNPEAFSLAYQKLKDKEGQLLDEKANVTHAVPMEITSKGDTILNFKSEKWTTLLANKLDASTYNVVVFSFINRTNARSLYNRMVEEKRPAMLVQNQDNLYRVVLASSNNPDTIQVKLNQLLNEYRNASIVKRVE